MHLITYLYQNACEMKKSDFLLKEKEYQQREKTILHWIFFHTKENEKLKNENHSLKDTLDEKIEDFKKLSIAHSKIFSDHLNLQNESYLFEEQILELTAQVACQEIEIRGLKEDIRLRKEGQLNEAKKSYDFLLTCDTQRSSKLEIELASLQHRIDQLNELNAIKSQKIISLKQDYEVLNENYLHQKEQNEKLQSENDHFWWKFTYVCIFFLSVSGFLIAKLLS